MGKVQTGIVINDGMSPALKSMSSAMNIMISNFETLQKASGRAIDTSSIQAARGYLNQAEAQFAMIDEQIEKARNSQEKFNSTTKLSVNSANNLLSKVRQIATAVGGIIGMQKAINLSDEVASNSARMQLIVDDGGSVKELEDKIFASAQRSRAAYLDTVSVVSKLGILAGKSFKNNDEMIAFTELMNKNFAIGGASIQEQTSAMYQLTQAMAAGKLQGDEFRSIMENAPLLADAIANYTGKTKRRTKGNVITRSNHSRYY